MVCRSSRRNPRRRLPSQRVGLVRLRRRASWSETEECNRRSGMTERLPRERKHCPPACGGAHRNHDRSAARRRQGQLEAAQQLATPGAAQCDGDRPLDAANE
jgi:hypothetical protein